MGYSGNIRPSWLWLSLIALIFCNQPAIQAEVHSPLSPAESLKHFQLEPGLVIELVACEPEVVDPVAIRFDERGQLWVVEMRDYPHGPPEGQPPLSTIRVLTDADGDGRYESSRLFADQLLFPTGLQPWQGGAIVTLAGEVVYLKDSDGDGRADVHQSWYQGFTAGNPQLRANHPQLGLDGRVYVANGLLGGKVSDPRRPEQTPVSISGRDFSFDPRAGDCQAITGNGQFGLTFDVAGRRFVCSNRQPLDHVVLEDRYLARNPLLAVPEVQTAVAAAGETSRVYPLTSAWTTSNLHAGQFTAACGIEIDRGSSLGADFAGSSFTCEPTGSLVHREKLTARGATFRGEPATPGKEFLASPDSWFRPVNLQWGPDGGLYVVDMYRAVIEHPQFMPEELQTRPDLRLGDDRGRIYRIRRAESPRESGPPPATLETPQLVERLAHPHSWQRETAARLLLERNDPAAEGALTKLASGSADPTARIAAMWMLKCLGRLELPVILAAVASEHPQVREQALVLGESLLVGNDLLQSQLLGLAGDDNARVRFQAALSLGNLGTDEALRALAEIGIAGADDVWTRRAVATAPPDRIGAILSRVLASPQSEDARQGTGLSALCGELAAIVGARRDPGEVAAIIIQAASDDPASRRAGEAALLGLAQGMARRGTDLVNFVATADVDPQAREALNRVFARSLQAALSDELDEAERAQHLKLLAFARDETSTEACLELVRTSSSQGLKSAAAAALADRDDARIGQTLLGLYGEQTPGVRASIRGALVRQATAAQALLQAVKEQQISRGELGAAIENQLKQHRDPSVRQLAESVLATAVPAERKLVLGDYQQALKLAADPLAGKQLFRQHCATCHKIGDVGVDVAPDISDSRVKTPAQLLTDILNPNQAIDNNYVSYTVVMSDGSVHTGIIAAESASSVTLRQPENKTLTLLRADVEALRSSGVSLMPEGFEKHLSHRQMADLISFIKNWRYLDQPIPGTIGASGAK